MTVWIRFLPMLAALSLIPLAGARGADCNENGVEDAEDLALGTSDDCDLDGIPDECARPPVAEMFGEAVPLPLPQVAWGRLRPADFDGDGDLDLVTHIRFAWSGGFDTIVLLSNRGDGTFTSAELWKTKAHIEKVHIADLDGDGDDDLLTVLRENDDSTEDVPGVLSFLNDGSGEFSIGDVQPSLASTPRSSLLADLDGDGDLDVAYNDFGTYVDGVHVPGSTLEVQLNGGNGRFEPARSFPTGNSPDELVATDLDGDGDLDLVASNTGDVRDGPTVDTVNVLLNHGDASFAAPIVYPVGYPATAVRTEDFDGDGDQDLLTASWVADTLSIFLNRGDGSFNEARQYVIGEGDKPTNLVVFDADADGDQDVIASTALFFEDSFVAILLNDGSGAFTTWTRIRYARDQPPFEALPTDIDEDGDVDIAVALAEDEVAFHLNEDGNAAPTFDEPIIIGVEHRTTPDVYRLVPGDFDGDGDLDLIAGRVLLRKGGSRSQRGCETFLRGDVNSDGVTSISDLIMLRRALFLEAIGVDCRDAADTLDEERLSLAGVVQIAVTLFLTPDWPVLLPEPSLAPGRDPTYAAAHPTDTPFGCAEYTVTPAMESDDHFSIGSVVAAPGGEVEIPIYVTNTVPVEGFQLVLTYDPALLDVVSSRDGSKEGLSFTGTFYESFEDGEPVLRELGTHPEAGVLTIGIVGALVDDGGEIPPGTDRLVAKILARVSETAPVGTEILLESPATGVGPYGLRTELTVRGEARFVSTLPFVEAGRLAIVGDQAFFRGDSNQDDTVDLSDAVHTLSALFLEGFVLACEDAADADDTGVIDLTDGVFTLNHLFFASAPIPPPYAERGLDPTQDALGCRGR